MRMRPIADQHPVREPNPSRDRLVPEKGPCVLAEAMLIALDPTVFLRNCVEALEQMQKDASVDIANHHNAIACSPAAGLTWRFEATSAADRHEA